MAYQLQITTAEGTQVLPLNGIENGNIPAAPSASYTLLDEQGNPVIEDLSLTRKGDNLTLEVEGESVANIEEFYTVDGSQYVVDGSQSLINGAASAENMVISSSGLDASGNIIAQGAVWQAETSFLGLSTLQLVGAGLGSAAVVAGAAVSGSDSDSGSSTTPDTTAPEITSGTTAAAIDENSGANQVVYTVTATDDNPVTYSLSGDDASLFTIDSTTGDVTLIADPDYETQSSYNFNVVATDEAGNESEQAVSLDINDLNEVAPTNIFTGAAYDEASNTLTLIGTDMNTLLSDGEDATTDIKDNLNWDNLTWDINTDNNDSNNVNFSLSDINSVSVQDDNTLTITLTDTAASSLEGSDDFDDLTEDNSIQITTGFSVDTEGNVATTDAYAGEAAMDTSIVVFDLVNGENSSHSDRSFDADVSYTIYIIVSGQPAEPVDIWEGASNLGSDDFVVLVSGDGNPVTGYSNNLINGITHSAPDRTTYKTSYGRAAVILDAGYFTLSQSNYSYTAVRLWSAGTNGDPSVQVNTLSGNFTLTALPSGVLTSQGLV
ncbi:cadherin repeat domain-containing protein [Psychromonas algicola]|uniref:cadherin repeat domain-containing protein n=1 Tax=Psychromonas algicola TaxID=2555642 RepID=UPI001419F7C8|nr:cadherin repeat domain-containing protein [Psychromonas sp. RZ5]